MRATDYLIDIISKYHQIISQIEQVCLDADHGYINTSEAYSRIKSLVIKSGEMYSNVNTEKVTQSMEYKGYTGSIEFSKEDSLFFGKVLGISTLISYEGKTMDALVEDFRDAIDEYLAWEMDEKGRKGDEL